MHAADLQDRDGGVLVMSTLFGLHPFLLKLYADGGYQGPQFQDALRRVCGQISLEIVKRCATPGLRARPPPDPDDSDISIWQRRVTSLFGGHIVEVSLCS